MVNIFTEHGIYKTSSDILPVFDNISCVYEKNLAKPSFFKDSHYIFIYLIKGSGEITLSNRTQRMSSGDFIICRPNESRFFTPDQNDPVECYIVSFKGRYVSDLLSGINLIPKKNYFAGHDNEIISSIERVMDESAKGDSVSMLIASSLFIATLGTLSRLAITILPKSNDKGYEKIAPALSSINSDCTSKIGVDDYAKMCNLSTSYFTHLFTKITGLSPMEYKQLQRIGIAKNLLSTTTLSVKEISTIIGFKDPLYFGRCFKQATGQTPTGYRTKK